MYMLQRKNFFREMQVLKSIKKYNRFSDINIKSKKLLDI